MLLCASNLFGLSSVWYRNLKEVDFDVDRFMKDMESFVRRQGNEETIEEGSSSDMEFGEWDFYYFF